MRIILADHHAQPCWAIRVSLEEQPDFDFIGEAEDAPGLLMLAKEHTTDLVLVDRELPGISIGELIARLHALEPRVIVMVMSSEIEYGRMILKAGADAFVSKGEPDWLLEKLHRYAEQVNRRGGCV